MSWGDFLRKNLMQFFIIFTCITIAIGVFGLIYEPDRRFGYEAFFSPLIFGIISVLPSFVTFSVRELTAKQLLVRKIMQLLVLEVLILSFGYFMGIMKEHMLLSVAFSVLVIDLLVHLISWVITCRNAIKLNEDLKAYQTRR